MKQERLKFRVAIDTMGPVFLDFGPATGTAIFDRVMFVNIFSGILKIGSVTPFHDFSHPDGGERVIKICGCHDLEELSHVFPSRISS